MSTPSTSTSEELAVEAAIRIWTRLDGAPGTSLKTRRAIADWLPHLSGPDADPQVANWRWAANQVQDALIAASDARGRIVHELWSFSRGVNQKDTRLIRATVKRDNALAAWHAAEWAAGIGACRTHTFAVAVGKAAVELGCAGSDYTGTVLTVLATFEAPHDEDLRSALRLADAVLHRHPN